MVNREILPRMASLPSYMKHLEKVKAWLAGQPNISVLYIRYNEMIAHPADYAGKSGGISRRAHEYQAMSDVPQEQFYRQLR
ncbi:MAG: hypothetical protein IPP55_16560 [Anaerolineales bacterium]|nr:hypothetical protein [Anaerolineales bacterium]